VQTQRQARRALLAGVLALPLAVATRPAVAEEEKAELGEVKDLDIRLLILSTILMGVAGFTAVGAASTPGMLTFDLSQAPHEFTLTLRAAPHRTDSGEGEHH
jgi:hypothetical protein